MRKHFLRVWAAASRLRRWARCCAQRRCAARPNGSSNEPSADSISIRARLRRHRRRCAPDHQAGRSPATTPKPQLPTTCAVSQPWAGRVGRSDRAPALMERRTNQDRDRDHQAAAAAETSPAGAYWVSLGFPACVPRAAYYRARLRRWPTLARAGVARVLRCAPSPHQPPLFPLPVSPIHRRR